MDERRDVGERGIEGLLASAQYQRCAVVFVDEAVEGEDQLVAERIVGNAREPAAEDPHRDAAVSLGFHPGDRGAGEGVAEAGHESAVGGHDDSALARRLAEPMDPPRDLQIATQIHDVGPRLDRRRANLGSKR